MISKHDVEFVGGSGKLTGVVERPAETRATAILAHCFSCAKDMRGAREISRTLSERGFAVLRFDFAGLGRSEGVFGEEGISSDIRDIEAASSFMGSYANAPQILIGHSFGGAAALVAAGGIAALRGVATIGAPSESRHVTAQFEERVEEIVARGAASVDLGGRRFTISSKFIDDLDSDRVLTAAAALHKPLLVLHAPLDATVGVENAKAIFDAARHPKSFVSLDSADHLLSRPEDARYAAVIIDSWSSRFLR